MRQEIKFESVKEFVNYLIDNEGVILADGYGREWCFKKNSFMFKDSGNSNFEFKLAYTHLFNEWMQVTTPTP